jgi:hypothetical protein
VRRETGKEYEVKVLYGEGVANHTGPEPCDVVCEGGVEASVGGHAGWPLSRERLLAPSADAVPWSEGNTVRRKTARTDRLGVVVDPSMHARSLHGNREVSRLAGRRRAAPVRIGKARSRSR